MQGLRPMKPPTKIKQKPDVTTINPRGLCLFLSLLLCSCATENPVRSRLPATVAMNPDAGREGLLMVTVRLANDEKVPLVLDTGAPLTVFDKSLEPKLGKRLDSGRLWNFGVEQDAGVYAMPRLYLGKVPLQTAGTNTVTFDRQKLADRDWPSFRGFLGMDVLQNYCLQLDFAAGKVRFLDDEHADKTAWGQAFPLTDIGDGCFSINENLAGVKGLGSVIDTGCNDGGWLRPALFRQWTNQESSADEKIYSPDGTLGGEIYHDLDLRPLDARALAGNDAHIKFNGLGLRVLAENLVTLDFPKRTMYLKRTSGWPLQAVDTEAAVRLAARSSIQLLYQLWQKGRLPGASKYDHGRTTDFHFNHYDAPYLDSGTWDALKNGDSSIYHYTFARTVKNGPWKLQKAWRTDQNGHTLEAYLLP
jgi:hypothetical protein